jgi:hypothetical protein
MGREFSHRLNTDETQILENFSRKGAKTRRFWGNKNYSLRALRLCVSSVCEIEIRATHEIMAARTTQLALLVDQLMPALQAKTPMLAGNVFSGNGTRILTKIVR